MAGPSERAAKRRSINWGAGVAVAIWGVLVITPLWFMLGSSLRSRPDFMSDGPIPRPTRLTLDNYREALIENQYWKYFANTAIVTVATVALVLLLALPAAYAVVRSRSRLMQGVFGVFLLGLAVPAQAAIIPIYLMITRFRLYDSLTAIVLPTVAFALPLSVVVLAGALRDIPRELYEAMTLDGGGAARIFKDLVVPLGRSGVIAVTIYTSLTAWNGFLFPLILTQNPDLQVLTLSLWRYQTEHQVNTPGLMAAVFLSALPIFLLYLVARRWLVAGLTGGFSR